MSRKSAGNCHALAQKLITESLNDRGGSCKRATTYMSADACWRMQNWGQHTHTHTGYLCDLYVTPLRAKISQPSVGMCEVSEQQRHLRLQGTSLPTEPQTH